MSAPQILELSIVAALLYLTGVAAAAVVGALNIGGRRSETVAANDALSASRFTSPVSVLVPVSGNEGDVSRTAEALLGLDYPELEVIVVGDAGAGNWLDSVVREWQLEAREFFYRRSIETAAVRRIYRSARDPRLIVIDKIPAGLPDALNCGTNMARYRYVMSVDPDIHFDPDALLRVMSGPLRDPAHVVGASAHVERGTEAGGSNAATFQRLACARSLVRSRLSRLPHAAGIPPHDAIIVWRRDAVLAVKGFSTRAADMHLDLLIRIGATVKDARFERGAEVFGRADARSLRDALRAAAERQSGAVRALATWTRRGAGSLAHGALGSWFRSELLTPCVELWAIAAPASGAAMGWLGWSTPVLTLIVLSFGHATISAAAVLARGSSSGAPEGRDLVRALVAGPLELMLYQPVLLAGRVAGMFSLASSK